MPTIYYPAAARGHANFGWLDAHHSFSFGQWYNPEKVHFGALRVLNDDVIMGGGGFGMHPHDNMEIVTIPLSGAIAHKDSTGADGVIETNDVQIMSAGSGIRHSEYNYSKTDSLNLLQIWVFPKQENISPRYEQKTYNPEERKDQWQVIASPDPNEGGVWINQDSRFSLVDLSAGSSIIYANKFAGNGAYVFLVEGSVEINGQVLNRRDALGISDSETFVINPSVNSKVLVIEVPMELGD